MLGLARSRVALCALSGTLMLTVGASAQDDPDALAKRHFESGAAYFQAAEYEEALRAFRKAYELSHRPQILLSIAIVEERLGNVAGAVGALDEYLAAMPDDPGADTLRLRRDNLKKRLGEKPSGAAPAPPPPAGQQPPTPTSPAPASDTEPPAAAGSAPLEPGASPAKGASDDDPAESEGPNRVPAYVVLTLGGLAGVGALITGLLAKGKYDDLKGSCADSCTDEETASGEGLALTSTVLTGVAVVGVGVGAILWVTASDTPGDEVARGPAPQIGVSLGPYGGGAQARWRF